MREQVRMTSLAAFIAQLAAHTAHERGWSRDHATRWVRQRVVEAREEYGAIGTPLGDTDAGFMAWLMPRKQPPAA
jgi:hypothetical protein